MKLQNMNAVLSLCVPLQLTGLSQPSVIFCEVGYEILTSPA